MLEQSVCLRYWRCSALTFLAAALALCVASTLEAFIVAVFFFVALQTRGLPGGGYTHTYSLLSVSRAPLSEGLLKIKRLAWCAASGPCTFLCVCVCLYVCLCASLTCLSDSWHDCPLSLCHTCTYVQGIKQNS